MLEDYICDLLDLPPFVFEDFAPWVRLKPYRGVPRLILVHPHCRETAPDPTLRFMAKLRNNKVIVLVRDPRDVVFTYYFRLRKRMRDEETLAISLSEFIRHPELGIGRIVDFTNTWFRSGYRFDDFLFLRLESLKANPEQEFGRLVKFLDIPFDPALLSRVAGRASDTTTLAIEDGSARLSDTDLAFLDKALLELDPEIGYQVRNP